MAEAKFNIVKPTRGKFIDLTGRVFGRLTVVYFAYQKTYSYWHCYCSCGEWCIKAGFELTRKNRISGESCGCLGKERRIKAATRHGMSGTEEYKTWISMRKRCFDSKNPSYHRYGKRGISVDPKWNDSFEQFYKDVGPRPSSTHSLDRIDNDGNYEPGNCRWATVREQCNNTRVNRRLTHNGVTKTLSEWLGKSGTNEYARAQMRLASGWCDSCTLTVKKHGRCKHIGK